MPMPQQGAGGAGETSSTPCARRSSQQCALWRCVRGDDPAAEGVADAARADCAVSPRPSARSGPACGPLGQHRQHHDACAGAEGLLDGADEGKMVQAAHTMVRSLAGSLALVTCKEPLRLSITNNMRAVFTASVPELNEQRWQPLVEHCINQVVSENLDLGCSLVERAATEKAVRDIDEAMLPALQARRRPKAAGQFDAPGAAAGRVAQHLPEELRPQQNLNPAQLRIYEDFANLRRPEPLSVEEGGRDGRRRTRPRRSFLFAMGRCWRTGRCPRTTLGVDFRHGFGASAAAIATAVTRHRRARNICGWRAAARGCTPQRDEPTVMEIVGACAACSRWMPPSPPPARRCNMSLLPAEATCGRSAQPADGHYDDAHRATCCLCWRSGCISCTPRAPRHCTATCWCRCWTACATRAAACRANWVSGSWPAKTMYVSVL